jgi:hypothetical protein
MIALSQKSLYRKYATKTQSTDLGVLFSSCHNYFVAILLFYTACIHIVTPECKANSSKENIPGNGTGRRGDGIKTIRAYFPEK